MMAIRKDGIDTRDKILKAASEVFARQGYRNTTVADICRRAGSNVAAVNYHFGSKDALYVIVWRNAFEEALRAYPPDGGLPPDASAEQCLRVLVHSLLHRILGAGRLGHAGRILMREMSDPSEAIRDALHDMIRPLRERTHKIIKRLLGPKASDREIGFCEMSVIHQCLAMGFRRGKLPPGVIKGRSKPTPEMIDALVEHITKFSLAGIQAIRENISKNST